jgi:AmmeMemoRadiSam system protein A
MVNQLSRDERYFLLDLARRTIKKAVTGHAGAEVSGEAIPRVLQENGASFVTLTIASELRGCIGTLEAYQPLYRDVADHARQAALEDYRFPPVSTEEVPLLEIEISRLTPPVPLRYSSPADLPALLHPNLDGVILKDGGRRATFLPQVWEQLPDVGLFLSHLCQKMGAQPDLWRRKVLEVSIYHVEEFSEKHY